MEIVFVLLPVSILLAGIGLIAFLWCVKEGQYEDLDTPQLRILFDDDELPAVKANIGAKPQAEDDKAD